MPQFRYTGDDRREFPAIPALLDPDDLLEADSNPDPVFFVEVAPKPAPKSVVSTEAKE